MFQTPHRPLLGSSLLLLWSSTLDPKGLLVGGENIEFIVKLDQNPVDNIRVEDSMGQMVKDLMSVNWACQNCPYSELGLPSAHSVAR